MNKYLKGAASACAILVASVSFPQMAAAATVVSDMENWTVTTYDVSSGDTDFSWDTNSQYDITGKEVTVKTTNILMGALPIGTLYGFVIPNFFDPLPMKTIEVTMTGANSGASSADLPRVLDIIGADADFDKGGPAVPVFGAFVSGKSTPTVASEFWEMFPNPDFETVSIFAPVGFELQSIMIETLSTAIPPSAVPVPPAVWLFGSGVMGLLGVARRKRA